MLRPRIIPCLLVHNKGLVKSVKFSNYKYVGDPINAVKIFNEKMADELMLIDIDASANNAEPDYKMIEKIASECRMPLCYGGGIKNEKQAKKIFSLGVEKIAISSIALKNPSIISEISSMVGNQSVVIVIDIKKSIFGKYQVYINNAKTLININLEEFISNLETLGAGEIVLNSIDNDGTMKGYDFNLVTQIRSITTLPITILGGAGSIEDIEALIKNFGIIGAAAGSLFVFKGIYKAVLINYPTIIERDELILKNYI